MEIREAELPGIGRKFSLATSDGSDVVIVVHSTGKREVFRFLPCEDDPSPVLELSHEEARAIAGVLAGGQAEPVREDAMLQIMQGLHLRWVRVSGGSRVVGRTIRDLRVRERTGASVIAVARRTGHVPNPGPEEVFAPGDTVIVMGREEQVRAFEALMAQS
ncbi:MAG: cation:proton antiporter regulatory subunit [Gemmatimonadetes bacterium]|nr:cation:proton antiporter regulatory subunit [Gemmatimonadota bacterium]